MYQLKVKSSKNPALCYLEVEEGNIDFEKGLRCVVHFLNSNQQVLDKKLMIIEGDDFQKMMSRQRGIEVIYAKLLVISESDEIILP